VAAKTLLVFGARHLGRTIARELTAEGWRAAAVARSEETIVSFR
jgi:NAD(P)-dependent dehydrogenase (short-subunit alcohol dehydrogenase family)